MSSPLLFRGWMSTASLVAVLAVSFVGCDSKPDINLVTGKVTLDGSPYPNAQVRFVPESGRPAMGITDEAGNYSLTYLRGQQGAMPGSYKVDITTVYTSASDSDGGKEPPEKLPTKYNRLTELKATVEPGPNTFDFELTSK